MTVHVDLGTRGYDVHIERGGLFRAGEFLRLDRRVLIVTDDGVPAEYAGAVAEAAREGYTVTLPAGEVSKSLENFARLEQVMLSHRFDRTDCVVAVGGGVVGDLAGFAASCYMRGIDFYNVPTTLLAQVDSSVGGKTAVDFGGVKNIIGTFHQPKAVLIDTDTLHTLPARQTACGFAEVIKMALTSDARLFSLLESAPPDEDLIGQAVGAAVRIKSGVVARDEEEKGLRRVLNFGHTLGHGIEATGRYLHGECVALGMIPMCAPDVRARLIPVLKKFGLPTVFDFPVDEALAFAANDKKRAGGDVDAVFADEVGTFRIERLPFEDWCALVRKNLTESEASR